MAQLPSKKMINRMTVLMFCFLIGGFGLIVAQLFKLQIVQHEDYQQRAVEQQTRDTIISPKRGTIYDRNMKALAVSASVETVIMSPVNITSDEMANKAADGLSELLGVDRETILEKTKKNNQYEIIARKVEKDVADQVRQFVKDNDIKGISLVEDSKRYYPYGSFASHILGFTGTEGQGLEGLEAYYEQYLKGTPGRIISAKNARGSDMPFKYEQYVDAQNGSNLVLTIDEVVQHFLEKYLEEAVIENNATKGGIAICMDVNTGEILGATIKPDYDLNDPFTIVSQETQDLLATLEGDEYSTTRKTALEQQWRNKMIADTYEPGSVFKIITAAIGLDTGAVTPTTQFSCSGRVMVAGTPINCHKRTGHGPETFTQGIENSCNPVAIATADRVGSDTYLEYVKAFGLTEKTGIDLYGETTGIFHSAEVFQGPVERATTSFGQTFTITPIQMAQAIAASVNGGYLVTPHLAKELVDDENNVVQNFTTQVKRQVISEETSQKLDAILQSVVDNGTGKNARIMGYNIGGKTGTTIKTVDRVQGVEKKLVSFAAIAPADDPQLLVLVILDEPGITDGSISVGGGAMAAPVAKSVLENILPYMGINPQYTAEELASMEVAVVNVVDTEVGAAKQQLEAQGLKVDIEGEGEIVLGQIPRGGQTMPKSGKVILYTQEGYEQKMATVPNVVGKTAEQANQALVNAGLNIRFSSQLDKGSTATVVSQSELADTQVPEGTIVTVDFIHEVGD